MKPLYKTTLVIWTEYDPIEQGLELDDLAREANEGDAYCSSWKTTLVKDPASDPLWDGTEFFEAGGCDEIF